MRAHPDKVLPPTSTLRECFRYERSTGKLFWKKRPISHFGNEKHRKMFNTLFAGKEAGSVTDLGYVTVRVFGELYKAHRIIWKLVTGEEPPPILDHKDRRPGNNRWRNLRIATFSENFVNRSVVWAASGIPGVRRRKTGWDARIHKNKKCIQIGTFKTKREAVLARKNKELELYGDFAR